MICFDYINGYIRQTIKKNGGILRELEAFARENQIPIIHPEVASLLRILGLTLKPYRILEIGTAIGYSSILLSSVLQPKGKIDTIDRYELMIERARNNIKSGLTDVINIINGDAADILKHLDKQYDMIFLDAAKGQYLEFLPECLRVLKKGGLLISDNVLYKGMIANDDLVVKRKKTIVKKMRIYLDTICNTNELETSILPVGDGLAISYKK